MNLDIIKQVALNAILEKNPLTILYGTVTQVSPLIVKVNDNLILTEEFLVLDSTVENNEPVILIKYQNGQKYLLLSTIAKTISGISIGGVASGMSGSQVKALYTAYYPANNAMEGGFLDAMGNRLNPSQLTCAAPKSVPFGTKIRISNTNTKRDGLVYTVTDRGDDINIVGGVYHFDLLMSTNAECNAWGKVNGVATFLT